MTDFSRKCEILGDLWIEYRTDDEFKDFIEYNDIGLPIAYAVSTNLVKVEPQGELYINETWDLFIDALGLDYNAEYESLEDMLEQAIESEEEE